MIARVWQGWTLPAQADAYEELFRTAVVPSLRMVSGFWGAQLLRQDGEAETGFMTLTYFQSLDALQAFAGPDYETAVISPPARALLSRFEERCRHFQVVIGPGGFVSPAES